MLILNVGPEFAQQFSDDVFQPMVLCRVSMPRERSCWRGGESSLLDKATWGMGFRFACQM